jgi:hypothetical protein
MAWIAPTIAAVASLGSAAMGMGRQQNTGANSYSQAQLDLDYNNMRNQQLVQALVNQRAVAGSQDSFGTTVKYDPATNQWVTDLGDLPKASDTAAMQAGITRNTTDLQNQELVNQQAMRRAALASPVADAAVRDLSTFRPKSYGDLVGLLTQQSTEANRQAYDPLRADTLRSVARTGTAAAPILAQLGLGEAQNLRNSMRDNLISAMTSTDQINQSKRAGLENAAVNASSLATPNLGTTALTPSTANSTLAQLVAQRAGNAAYTTAAGAAGPNNAANIAGAGFNAARSTVPDPNFGLNQAVSGLKDLGTAFGKGGSGNDLISALFGSGSSPTARTNAANTVSGWENTTANDPAYKGVTW